MPPCADGVALWRDLGAYRALAQLPTRQAVQSALDPRVDALPRDSDPTVLATVEAYVDSCGDARATAARLHLHRGTLYYRLQKAERLSGLDLHDGEDRLAVPLGFGWPGWRDATRRAGSPRGTGRRGRGDSSPGR